MATRLLSRQCAASHIWRRAAIARSPLPLLVLASLATPAVAQDAGHDHSDLGDVSFQVSCDPAVRAEFDRAVGLLHHMMYEQARQHFEQIAEQNPECGPAHLGVAMTLFQPLWPARPNLEARQRGWEAVQRAQQHTGLTDQERGLLAATAAFFADPEAEEWWPRIARWSEALGEAHQQHPEDTETGAFYALSLLAAAQVADDRHEVHEQAVEILEEIHQREPRHPGAIHYTIHANDIAGRERESLDVVRSYDDIAPDVAHALHMPSHIYVRLGDWPQVMEWNRKSADAALRTPVGDRISFHYLHGLDYLLYGRLQRGEDGDALAVLEEFRGQAQPYQEDFGSAFHLAVMPARYAVERHAWDEAAAIQPRTPDYLAWDGYWWPESLSWFARGLGAVHTGDLASARDAEAHIAALRDRARAADEAAFATFIEIDRLILNGLLAQADGDSEAAVARLREAAGLEQMVEKHPITPGALLPPNEALGDLLLEQGRPEDALQAFETSLGIWPNRYNSLLGAARAARDAGDAERARMYYGRLLRVADGATAQRPGIQEAREVVGGGQ